MNSPLRQRPTPLSSRKMPVPSEHQQATLGLFPAPRQALVELLHRTFGNPLIPLEQIRVTYFRNLNPESFTKAILSGRITLPIQTLDPSDKAPLFVEIHRLAVYIELRAQIADEELTQRLATTEPTTKE
ncbi:pyocin activator PrtN family protein [Pseudomonas sp. NPDC086581]|uniref:pyocin activator PrtN family protein n=1 Tax=Pseudomonas sp. NPDC086581 TaxID=3364432 RepID=UPI0037F7377F